MATYEEQFAAWAEAMASDSGSGRVPGPEAASFTNNTVAPSAGKVGFKRTPPSRKAGRIPPISAAFARKL